MVILFASLVVQHVTLICTTGGAPIGPRLRARKTSSAARTKFLKQQPFTAPQHTPNGQLDSQVPVALPKCDARIMATPWPEDQIWPAEYREHATKLSSYLQKALSSIETSNGQSMEPRRVKHAIYGVLSLIVKIQGMPDLTHLHEAIRNAQNETKTASENTSKAISDIRDELKTANKMTQQTIATIQDNANVSRATGAAAKEAMEVGKTTMKMLRHEASAHAGPSQQRLYVRQHSRQGRACSKHA